MSRLAAGSTLVLVALAAALAAVVCLAVAGPGSRLGWWHFRTGFALFRWAVILAGASLLLALVGGALAQRWGVALAAIVAALAVAAVPLALGLRAKNLPTIHDVTTDPDDPPGFVAVVPLREGAPNVPEYDGAETAAAQRSAYPDIRPIELAVPPAEAFDRALATVRSLGWEVVAAVPGEGRIEATETTRWFGFKDDVVIRVRPSGAGSRVDVRSKSRVGKSDVGANAARIRRFRDALGR